MAGAPARKKSKAPRTLAEEIADLANPQPAYQDDDPELNDFGAEAYGGAGEGSEDSDDDGYMLGPAKGQPGKLPLRGSIALEEGAYAGKSSSRRKALEGSDDEVSFEQSDDDIIGDAEHGEEENGQAENGRMEEDEESEGDELEDDRAGGAERQENEGGHEEEDELEREYRELQEQEEEMLANVRKQSSVDRTKGAAVSNQRSLWNKWLELRIALHKLLQSGNRLPKPQAYKLYVESVPDAQLGLKKLSETAADTLEKLLAAQQALLDQNDSIAAARDQALNENGKRERPVDEGTDVVDKLWHQMDAQYSSWLPYRNASVDRWQRKTLLSSGAAAGRGKLRAINQSVTAQIANAMRDPMRLLSRTQMKADTVKAFGQGANPAAAEMEGATRLTDAVDQADNEEEPTTSRPQEEALDPETFDDTDFYQQLLKEFLDSSGASSGMSLYAMQKLRNNKKKVVDRRASKGRKIRYTVQQPLLNFMAPEPMTIPPMADRLFSTLFGQKNEGI